MIHSRSAALERSVINYWNVRLSSCYRGYSTPYAFTEGKFANIPFLNDKIIIFIMYSRYHQWNGYINTHAGTVCVYLSIVYVVILCLML